MLSHIFTDRRIVALIPIASSVIFGFRHGIGTNFEIVSNEVIALNDGTKANKTTIKWLYKVQNIRLTTITVSAYKGDKYVCLGSASWGDPEEVAWIVESLTFE
jgi:hypothetical protein